MVSELQLESPEGAHVLGAGFLPSRGEPFFLFLHIDEFADESKKKELFVQLAFQPKPGTKPPKALRDRPQQSDWAFHELTELIGTRPFICAIEAEILLSGQEPPTPVATVPLTIGSRALPIRGIEYGTEDADAEGVRGFRWTREEGGIKVWMSFTATTDAMQLPRAWDEQGKAAARYLKEVMGR
jgi:hypothetical protein